MTPSKDWMAIEDYANDKSYESGVNSFIDYAIKNLGTETLRCPCRKCLNIECGDYEEVRAHLLVYGISKRYTFWYHHGERLDEDYLESDGDEDLEGNENKDDDGVAHFLRDLFPCCNEDGDVGPSSGGFAAENAFGGIPPEEQSGAIPTQEPNASTTRFYALLKDSQEVVYEGCKISKISALLKLLHIKTLGRWSNASFTMLLEFLKEELLPEGSKLPDSYYESKKLIKDLGLSYEKIDACVNDCMLFWKENEDSDTCKVCGASRWKVHRHNGEARCKFNGSKIPQKTLRCFPVKERLQRLFMSSKTASLMTWHHKNRSANGTLRHPVDGSAWKRFDIDHPDFALDPRNVRLGLASDGFQPFANSKSSYSIWPVMLIPYNLPPEICMKQSNMILLMLIPGPKGLGDAIDTYLQPLVEELKELWETGVKTYDFVTKRHFQLRAALIWTFNDFPAYAMLSGWSTKGYLACPCCQKNTRSIRLSKSRKICYMSHRRYLPENHRWRTDKESFDGTVEYGATPQPCSIDEILEQLQDLENIVLSKDQQLKTKISHEDRGDNWNKKSCLFGLSYWPSMQLRHNLDVMHIEKNICDSILATLMNVKGKTKDNLRSRQDLEEMGLRSSLHPIKDGDKFKLPPAPYTFSPSEKTLFCSFLKDLKVPDGFASNISYCVNSKEAKISGPKSHDFHVILEHLLPTGICGLLTPLVREALTELSTFFTVLCAKVLDVAELEELESQIPITLCKLEKIFPPSFFDVMMHLPIHLANEAKVGGPVQFRWMYLVEQYMYKLKSYIRNKAQPEASIAEGYLVDECMTLCSRYMDSLETRFNRLDRNYVNPNGCVEAISIFRHPGRGFGAPTVRDLSKHEFEQAHIYILKNCDEVQPFLEQYSSISDSNRLEVFEKEWCNNFNIWFKTEISRLYENNKSSELEDLLSLSRGPKQYVISYNGYVVNGYRFRVESRDNTLRTQNSGIVVIGNTRDDENIDYYGLVTEILELQYLGGKRVVLFRCKWWDVYDKVRGIKIDEHGIVSINFKKQLKVDEPFILASQARQVFYANDNINKGWKVVLKCQPCNFYETEAEDNGLDEGEAYQHGEFFKPAYLASSSTAASTEACRSRAGLDPIIVRHTSNNSGEGRRGKRSRIE